VDTRRRRRLQTEPAGVGLPIGMIDIRERERE